MDGFTIVDGIVAVIIILSAVLAYSRGFVREVLSIGGWVLAAIAAYIFAPMVEPLMKEVPILKDFLGPSCELAMIAAFAAVFAVALIVFSIFTPLFAGAVQRSALGFATALLALMIACAAQSVGALLLLGASLALMIFWRLQIIWPLIVLGLATVLLAGALHLSGLVPLQWFAKQTEIGQFILSTFRSLGRGSFTWRIAQDLKAMALIDGGWLTGTMIWDWWRPAGIRPWGLWLLLVGQFGLLGFALAYGVLVTTAARGLSRLRGQRIWNRAAPAMPLALIVLVALADSLLNAFLYFPAILAAGALVRPEFAPDLEIDPNAADMTPSA